MAVGRIDQQAFGRALGDISQLHQQRALMAGQDIGMKRRSFRDAVEEVLDMKGI